MLDFVSDLPVPATVVAVCVLVGLVKVSVAGYRRGRAEVAERPPAAPRASFSERAEALRVERDAHRVAKGRAPLHSPAPDDVEEGRRSVAAAFRKGWQSGGDTPAN